LGGGGRRNLDFFAGACCFFSSSASIEGSGTPLMGGVSAAGRGRAVGRDLTLFMVALR
jgi:hypothetical protein